MIVKTQYSNFLDHDHYRNDGKVFRIGTVPKFCTGKG